jgi:hypothetical protein
MKRIVIYNIKGYDKQDVHFNNLFNEDEEERHDNLNYQEADAKINELINKYDMQPDHRIINYYFDQDEYLEKRDVMTVEEYLNLNFLL